MLKAFNFSLRTSTTSFPENRLSPMSSPFYIQHLHFSQKQPDDFVKKWARSIKPSQISDKSSSSMVLFHYKLFKALLSQLSTPFWFSPMNQPLQRHRLKRHGTPRPGAAARRPPPHPALWPSGGTAARPTHCAAGGPHFRKKTRGTKALNGRTVKNIKRT